MPKHADGPPISSGPYRKHWEVPGIVYDERNPERSVPVEEENKAKLTYRIKRTRKRAWKKAPLGGNTKRKNNFKLTHYQGAALLDTIQGLT